MAEHVQPRASIALWDGEWSQGNSLTLEQFAAAINTAKSRLQRKLQGTGLTVVGLPVIEKANLNGQIFLSFKIYSDVYPTVEAERG